MDPKLKISVLGDLVVEIDGAVVQLPPSKKTRALLAYLAVVDRPQRRQRLCEMYWEIPDDPRGALRWSLSKIRQIVNTGETDRLDSNRETVALQKDGIAIDYQAIARIPSDRLADLSTDALEAAVSLFRGRFLDDVSLPSCPEFEAWRVAIADEVELRRIAILRELLRRLHAEPARALVHARSLLSLDPDNDEIAREVERLAASAREEATRFDGPPVAELTAKAAPAPASTPRSAPVSPEPADARQDIRFCSARDGVRLAYALSGRGPPILRASHWMSHLEYDWQSPIWRHWIRGLSEANTLVRFDQRSSGLSGRGVEDLSFETMVSDLEAVADAAGLDRFFLLGISQGCAYSVAYAVRHPERVAGLILYGGYAQGWRRRGVQGEIARREAIMTLMREGWGQNLPVFRQLFSSMYMPMGSREQWDWFNDVQLRSATPEDAYRLAMATADIDVAPLLPLVKVPTIVLHARDDVVVALEQGRRLAHGIRGAHFVEIESPNHILLQDEPGFARLMDEVRRFLDEHAERARTSGATVRQRRQITALALDLISPLLSFDDLDVELGLETIEPVLERVADRISEMGGIVIARAENELTAIFGAKGAAEEHTVQACRAALRARDLVAEISGGTVRMRAGIDMGEAVVAAGPHFPTASGTCLRTARQLATMLRRDAVMITDRGRAAAGGYVETRPARPDDVAGVPRDRGVFEVMGEVSGLSRWQFRSRRSFTPLVGRELELKILEQAWLRAREGSGGLIGVVADPGVGKSRLTHEFLASEPFSDAMAIECGALEFDQDVSLSLARKLVQALLGNDGEDGREAAVIALMGKVEALGLPGDVKAPLQFLLDLTPDDPAWATATAAEQSRRLRDAVLALLEAEAERRPVLLLVEDLHWVDDASAAVLKRVAEGLRARPALLICTYRPSYTPAWARGHGFQEIALTPLRRSEAETFLRSILGDAPGMSEAVGKLADQTDGVPLFMEETVRALAHQGVLEGTIGAYRLTRSLDRFDLPSTVQSVIEASLDRLGNMERRVLQTAAAIGRMTSLDLLEEVMRAEPELFSAAVGALRDSGLLVDTRTYPVREVSIKHALVHAVAYKTLPRRARIALHGRILDVLEARAGRHPEIQAEVLAKHALRAEAWEVAVGYLILAARRALERSAHNIALAHIQDGLSALDHMPAGPERLRSELAFRKIEGIAWMSAKGWGAEEVSQAYRRAEEISTELADDTELFTVLRGRGQYCMISGRPQEAKELAHRCSLLIEGSDDTGLAIETSHIFWTNDLFLGDYGSVVRHARHGIRLYDPERHHPLTFQYSGHDPGVCCRIFAGLASFQHAEVEGARASLMDATELAGRFGHPLTVALTHWGLSYLAMFGEDAEAAREWAEKGYALCAEHQLPLVMSQCDFQAGWAMARRGDLADGIERMERAIRLIRATGAEMGLPYFLALLAEARARGGGGPQKAIGIVDEALAIVARNGGRFQLPEILRIKAGLLAEADGSVEGSVEAEQIYRQALAAARSQMAAFAEMRATAALAGHLRRSGRADEADELISAAEPLTAQLPAIWSEIRALAAI